MIECDHKQCEQGATKRMQVCGTDYVVSLCDHHAEFASGLAKLVRVDIQTTSIAQENEEDSHAHP